MTFEEWLAKTTPQAPPRLEGETDDEYARRIGRPRKGEFHPKYGERTWESEWREDL